MMKAYFVFGDILLVIFLKQHKYEWRNASWIISILTNKTLQNLAPVITVLQVLHVQIW